MITRSEYTLDNRDPKTTWLELDNGEVVEVDPVELFMNSVENCYEGRAADPEVDMSDLQAMVDYLNKVINGSNG